MARTLDAKLRLENTEAKKKAREVGEAAADGMTKAAEAAERTASATERMAENTKKAADSTTKAATSAATSAQTLSRFALSMGGMLLGSAAQAMAATMPESTTQKVLAGAGKVAGGASQGAAMGAPLGPWGMGIGAVLGAGAAGVGLYSDYKGDERKKQEAIQQTNKANRELLETMMSAQARTESFRATIDSLGDKEKSLAERQAEVAAEIEKRTREEERLKSGLKRNSGGSANEQDQAVFQKQVKDYQLNHGELMQLRQLQKALKANPATTPDVAARESIGAMDSLSRLGGSFAGAGYLTDRAQRTFDEQLTVLRSIDSKTTRGGATWQ